MKKKKNKSDERIVRNVDTSNFRVTSKIYPTEQ